MSVIADQIAEQIAGFLKRRKLELGLSQERVAKQILEYMELRYRGHPTTIMGPKTESPKPSAWTDHDEAVWQDWFSNEVHLNDWLREVFRPVFGMNTSACAWDYSCDGWRGELLLFLPAWAARTMTLVLAYDATQYESDDEDDTDPYNSKVDPYLADHGPRT